MCPEIRASKENLNLQYSQANTLRTVFIVQKQSEPLSCTSSGLMCDYCQVTVRKQEGRALRGVLPELDGCPKS